MVKRAVPHSRAATTLGGRTHFPSSLHGPAACVTLCHVTLRNTTTRPLTDLQQAILDIVWTAGTVTAEHIRERLPPQHRLSDSSVRTLLRRLEARGFLTHDLDGKVFVYRAAMPRRNVAARAVQHVIDRFCAGSAEQFLAGMVDEKVLTLEQIARLAKKIKGRS